MNYVYNILRSLKRWKLLLFIGCAIIVQNLRLSVIQLLELHKCPACYGQSACHSIREINLLWHDANTIFSHLFGVKNVFFGTYGRNKVVLKKLAHSSELKALDVKFCDVLSLKYPCSNISNGALESGFVHFCDLVANTITADFSNDDSSRLRLCPTINNFYLLFHNVFPNIELNEKPHIESIQYFINFWTLIFVNPEPLILQILPAEDGWPVPKYFGACGRIVVEEYVGPPLVDYYDKSWIQRAKIASSLLDAAYTFTFKNENFGFYLTDISADNIAVNHEDVAKFIDLENIIVVDKNIFREDRSKGWQELQENKIYLDCPNCFAFSSEDICNHRLSDHNYYAICQLLLGSAAEHLFPDGFLHDTPAYIRRKYPANIEYLLQQCAVPTNSTNSRIFFGQRLKKSLDAILKEVSEHEHNEMK